MRTLDSFKLNGKVCVVTGGAGFLGKRHAEAILEAGGKVILIDINEPNVNAAVLEFKKKYAENVMGIRANITDKKELMKSSEKIMDKYKKIDVLINNAANNPKMELKDKNSWTRFENFSEAIWDEDIAVSLKGAFLCSQIFGNLMAENKNGVILNVSSDLGIIAPDQRIYRKDGLELEQTFKPVTYSVVKHGLLGLTKYLATYWAESGIRVNSICPGGIYNGQDDNFVAKLTNLIPMGRMADKDEYKAAIVFLISDASSYMTGSTLIIDGGRTCW